ncbi:hypothetical protein KCU81_g148, partial [Aureobasidium melanogenum]
MLKTQISLSVEAMASSTRRINSNNTQANADRPDLSHVNKTNCVQSVDCIGNGDSNGIFDAEVKVGSDQGLEVNRKQTARRYGADTEGLLHNKGDQEDEKDNPERDWASFVPFPQRAAECERNLQDREHAGKQESTQPVNCGELLLSTGVRPWVVSWQKKEDTTCCDSQDASELCNLPQIHASATHTSYNPTNDQRVHISAKRAPTSRTIDTLPIGKPIPTHESFSMSPNVSRIGACTSAEMVQHKQDTISSRVEDIINVESSDDGKMDDERKLAALAGDYSDGIVVSPSRFNCSWDKLGWQCASSMHLAVKRHAERSQRITLTRLVLLRDAWQEFKCTCYFARKNVESDGAPYHASGSVPIMVSLPSTFFVA